MPLLFSFITFIRCYGCSKSDNNTMSSKSVSERSLTFGYILVDRSGKFFISLCIVNKI